MSNRPNTYWQTSVLFLDALLTILIYICLLCFDHKCEIDGAWMSLCLTAIDCLIVVLTGGVVLFRQGIRKYRIVSLCLRNAVVFALLNTLVLYVTGTQILSALESLLFYTSSFVASVLLRGVFFHCLTIYRSKTNHRKKVIFVGSTENNVELADEMMRSPILGFDLMGYFDYERNAVMDERLPYLGMPKDVNEYLSSHREVREVFCCLPSNNSEDILSIIHFSLNNLVNFNSVPNVRNYVSNHMYYHLVGNVPYLSLYISPLSHNINRATKRIFDIVFSLLFLLTLFIPILIVVSIVTTITMPGPIFFVQERNGLRGKRFRCIKFRSMKKNAQSDTLQATQNDPRITKWGNIMRKTNLDEVPQFINVLIGEMSIVGPRPHMVKHTNEYSRLIDKYMVRHLVKPGITGWAQVTGFRGETKELWKMEGRVKQDIWYIEHWSFGLDLFIIFKTIYNAIRGDKNAF